MDSLSQNELFPALGFELLGVIDGAPKSLSPAFRARTVNGQECVLTHEVAPPTGLRGLEAAFARGYLRSARCAKLERLRPVVVLTVRSLTDRTARRFQRFVWEALGPDTGFVITDGRTCWRSGSGIELTVESLEPGALGSVSSLGGARSDPLFTDGMLVCLKAILAADLGVECFGLPHPVAAAGGRRVAARLAVAAAVSESQAYRFLSAYRKRHFVAVRDGAPRIRHRAEILSDWSERFRHAFRTAVRASTGEVELSEWIRHARPPSSTGGRAAIGAHQAAEHFGVSAVAGAALTLHIEGRPADFARSTALELNPMEGANVLLVTTRFPRGVFGPALPPRPPGSIPSVDLVQCYLDARAHPHRGGDLALALATRFPGLLQDESEG